METQRNGGAGSRCRPWPALGLAVCVGLLAGSGTSQAQAPAGTSAAPELTLNAVVEIAVRENPDLKSLRAKWEAMQERPAQAGTLANPMLTYSGMDATGGGSWPDTNEKRVMVQQEFPWFGKRALREGVAAKDAEAMKLELDAMTRDVVMRVKERYYELHAVQQVIAITGEEEEVVRRVERTAESMYAVGAREQVDVLKAQAEITLLKQKLVDLQAQEATLHARLNTLMNRGAALPLGAAVTPPGPEVGGSAEARLALAAAGRPEVLAAQAQVERYELERKLMAKEFVPDYKLGLEYRDVGDSDDMVMFTVSVDLPLWRSKYRSGVREAEKMRDSSEAAREAAERQSDLDVQVAALNLQAARRTLTLYRSELIPQAEARFSASEAGYRTGKVDFMDLLESERFLLGAKTMAAMAEGMVGMQAARLEWASGVDAAGETAGVTGRK